MLETMDRGTAAAYRTVNTVQPQGSGFAFCCACLVRMRALRPLPRMQGCKDAKPSEQLDLWGPPGLPAGRQRVLPQPPVLTAATR